MTGVRLYPHINCMFNLPMVNAVVFFQLLCAPKELGQQRGCSWPHVLLLLIYLLSEMNFIFFLNALRVLFMVQFFSLENFFDHFQRIIFVGLFFPQERWWWWGGGGVVKEEKKRKREILSVVNFVTEAKMT